MSAYNFGVGGCSPIKLWHLTCLYVGVLPAGRVTTKAAIQR